MHWTSATQVFTGKHDQSITVNYCFFFPIQFAAHEQKQSCPQENELFLEVTQKHKLLQDFLEQVPLEGPLLTPSRVFSVHIQLSHCLFISSANDWVSTHCAPLPTEAEYYKTANKLTSALQMSSEDDSSFEIPISWQWWVWRAFYSKGSRHFHYVQIRNKKCS